MRKKSFGIFFVICALALVLGLSACDNDKNADNAQSGATQSVVQQSDGNGAQPVTDSNSQSGTQSQTQSATNSNSQSGDGSSAYEPREHEHNYKFVEFVWAGDFTAQVKFVCAEGNETEYFAATVTSEVTTEPMCETEGLRTYTATYGENSDVKTETIPARGHDKVSHEGKAATCTESGWAAYDTCTRCDYTTYVEIPAAGHDFYDDVCKVCGKSRYTKGLDYSLNNDGQSYSVTGLGTATDTDVVIPDSYDNKPVTKIGGSAFYNCRGLTSVTIGNNVKNIDDYAFKYCGVITSVIIPDGVTRIGNSAFYECGSLTSVSIPDSVTFIGGQAFAYCNNLKNIEIGEGVTGIDINAFYKCYIENATIPAFACRYINNDKLKTVVITGGEIIGENALANCKSLTSVTIPNSVKSIESGAFSDCSGLTSVVIPNSVTSIGTGAFLYCSGLTSVAIPGSVESIGENVFYYCDNLINIEVDDNNSYYRSVDGNLYKTEGYILIQYALGKTATSFSIPDGVSGIGDLAFCNCASLTSVIIPESVTSIGASAFFDCAALTSVTIGGATLIGSNAFNRCSSLKSVDIPDSVTSIGQYAFYNCNSLTSIKIPSGVTSIAQYTFYNCSALTSVTIGGDVTSIDSKAFYNCSSLTDVSIPESVTTIGEEAFYNCSSLTSIIIPDGVTSISDSAFSDCRGLTNLSIGKNVTSIGNAAFRSCDSLTSVIIPDGVTSIGNYAFASCSSLKSVTIPDSVTRIITTAFEYSPIETATLPAFVVSILKRDTLKTVIITTGETISNYTFYNCGELTSVTIPNCVTYIDSNAFYNCSSLTSIVFNGTKAEWQAIEKGSNWKNNVPATVVVCTDGSVSL